MVLGKEVLGQILGRRILNLQLLVGCHFLEIVELFWLVLPFPTNSAHPGWLCFLPNISAEILDQLLQLQAALLVNLDKVGEVFLCLSLFGKND